MTTIQTHIHACRTQRHNKDERHSSFEKYTSHFIERVVWEGVGDRTELQHIDPTLLAMTAFLSHSPGLLNRGPWAPASLGHIPQSSIFSPTHLIANSSDLQLLNRGSRRPLLLGAVFSTASFYNSLWTSCALSYIIVRRPVNLFPQMANGICNFRSLWNGIFWSSSSGNNCHAVHRSPSSGSSVCACTLGF